MYSVLEEMNGIGTIFILVTGTIFFLKGKENYLV
jgi:hypothetical protein